MASGQRDFSQRCVEYVFDPLPLQRNCFPSIGENLTPKKTVEVNSYFSFHIHAGKQLRYPFWRALQALKQGVKSTSRTLSSSKTDRGT